MGQDEQEHNLILALASVTERWLVERNVKEQSVAFPADGKSPRSREAGVCVREGAELQRHVGYEAADARKPDK